jgi:phosphatidylinositol kinase/protein kinase (PI-3  family)
MGVLRDNRESLSAVLEAFVYDPLTAWRLLQTTDDRARDRNGGQSQWTLDRARC